MGFLIIGIFLAIGAIVLLFNSELKNVINQTCDISSSCEAPSVIALPTNLSLIIFGAVLIIGLFFIFSKEGENLKGVNLKDLSDSERKVVEILKRENGEFFQKDIMKELGVGKVKMTRLVDGLESSGAVERRRKGMNNVIVLVG